MNPARRAFIAGGAAFAAAGLCGCDSGARPGSPGNRFPDFRLSDIDGKVHDSKSMAGHPFLINFWATWCPPCRAEMPDLDALHKQFFARGLRVFGISIDEDIQPVREFRLRTGVSFPLIMDSGRVFAHLLKVTSFPTSFLVSGQGTVTEVLVGPRSWLTYPGVAALLT